jgi:ATP-dependent DNA helicase RecG
MEDAELLNLWRDLESDRVERKRNLTTAKTREEVAQAVCAFANDLPGHDRPGVILIGVEDDGACAGLPVRDQDLQTLAAIRSDGNVLPPPSLDVQKRVLEGCEVAVAFVHPASAPPVRYKGTIWVRVGPRRGIANAEDERRLAERRRAGDPPFELRPARAELSDLDLDYFRQSYLPQAVSAEVLAANERTVEQQLASLHFATPAGRPTYLGILTLGRSPQDVLPDAYVQFVRFPGAEVGDTVVSQAEIAGRLGDQLAQLDLLVGANNTVALHIPAAGPDEKRPHYPPEALQQILWNAILHRTYDGVAAPIRVYWFSDRVEIVSPGGPYGGVTPQNFGEPGLVAYRNLHLADVLKTLGYVQRFGIGLRLAQQAMARNGNPPIEFDVTPARVIATLRARQ